MTGGFLFSGIGGFERAAETVGMELAWSCEIDPFCRRVLARHWPQLECFEDVRAIDAAGLRPIDLLAFGSPCQDFSVAGQRAGIGGDRSSLFFEAIRLARALRPNWLVFENVPGLLSSWSPVEPPPESAVRVDGSRVGRRAAGAYWDVEEESDFAAVVTAFSELGYCWAYRVCDAQFFGVAQRRRRVFLVGCLGEQRLAALLPFVGSGNRHPAPRRQPQEDIAPTLDVRAGRSGETSFHTSGGLAVSSETAPSLWAKSNDPHRDDMAAYVAQVSGTLAGAALEKRACGSNPVAGMLVAHTLRGEGFDASEDGTGRGTPLVVTGQPVAFTCKDHGADAGDLAPTLRAMGHTGSHANGGGQVAVAFSLRGREDGAQAEVAADGLANTLRTSGGGSSHQFVATGISNDPTPKFAHELAPTLQSKTEGGGRMEAVAFGPQVRRLSPTECERLQGVSRRDPETGEWSDGHTCLCGHNQGRSVAPDGKTPCLCADGPRYRALGNSVAVPNVEWILRRIVEAEARMNGVDS